MLVQSDETAARTPAFKLSREDAKAPGTSIPRCCHALQPKQREKVKRLIRKEQRYILLLLGALQMSLIFRIIDPTLTGNPSLHIDRCCLLGGGMIEEKKGKMMGL